jgi:hypothetical protein
MAPEQFEKPQSVDHRADIFSLGVVFYEMLTGQLPLGKFAPPSRKVRIDARLDEVVLRALEHEPELRYQHAAEVKTHIDTIASTPPNAIPSEHTRPRVSQSAPPPAGSLRSPGQRRLSLARAVSLLVMFVCVGFLIATVHRAFSPQICVARTRFIVDQSNHGGDPYFLQSQAALVTSFPVLYRVAASLHPSIKRQWSEEAGVSPLTDEAIASRLRSALSVRVLPASDILEIRASAKTYIEAGIIASQVSYAFRGWDDGVRRTLLDEEPSYDAAPSPLERLAVGGGLGLLLGLVVVAAVEIKMRLSPAPARDKTPPPSAPATPSGEPTRPRVSQSAPPPTASLKNRNKIFSWLALGFFIMSLIGGPVLLALGATGAAFILSGLGLVLALVFGLVSWREPLGRVIVIVTIVLLVLAIVPMFLRF